MASMAGRGRGELRPPQGWRVGRAGFQSAPSGERPGTWSSGEPPPPTAAGELPASVSHIASPHSIGMPSMNE